MNDVLLLNTKQIEITIRRLCFQLIENHNDFSDSVIIGLQPRGVLLAQRIQEELIRIRKTDDINCGSLDITFFRDDFRRSNSPLNANSTEIDFILEGKKVILIDDVLYTGRTIRAGLDAMLSYGRPAKVELLVLIDRRFSRQLPIIPDYVGKVVDSLASEKVAVEWSDNGGEEKVILFTSNT